MRPQPSTALLGMLAVAGTLPPVQPPNFSPGYRRAWKTPQDLKRREKAKAARAARKNNRG